MVFVYPSLQVLNSLIGLQYPRRLHLPGPQYSVCKCSVCNALYVYMFSVCNSCSVCQSLILPAFLCLSAHALLATLFCLHGLTAMLCMPFISSFCNSLSAFPLYAFLSVCKYFINSVLSAILSLFWMCSFC
jgi:hypothetical protein